MKIPETTPNVGAYYGSEENGQWQPNGVIMDGGIGGGVVGSGDAGLAHAYPHPHHAHPHPGYVMAGAYYPPPHAHAHAHAHAPPDDFSDYMWMENEEEFDKQVMRQLEDEALMEQCIEAMLDHAPPPPANGCANPAANGASSLSLEETVSRSTLNPMAAEFVPTCSRIKEEREKPVEVSASAEVVLTSATETDTVDSADDTHTLAAESPPSEPAQAQASAATTSPQEKRPEARKPKKPPAKKPEAAKSDTKLPAKKEPKKEARTVKSESKIEPSERQDAPVPVAPAESVKAGPAPLDPKPINYAAAAKANKPKKPSPPPVPLAEKTPPPPAAVAAAAKSQDKLAPAKSKPEKAATKPTAARASSKN